MITPEKLRLLLLLLPFYLTILRGNVQSCLVGAVVVVMSMKIFMFVCVCVQYTHASLTIWYDDYYDDDQDDDTKYQRKSNAWT